MSRQFGLLFCLLSIVFTSSYPSPVPPNLAIPGGGIYYYHLAGQLKHLREVYPIFDLSSPPSSYTLHGASAGALAATLWNYDVSIEDATNEAIRLSDEIDLWNRKLGLYGIWGPIIRSWLDTLLPPPSTFIPPTNLNLLLTPATFPHLTDSSLPRHKVSTFNSKEDLIDANMASVHLPLFLDNSLTTEFQSKPYIDGSFQSTPLDYGPPETTTFLDYEGDEKLMQSRGGFVKLISRDGVWDLIELGYHYARLKSSRGDFRAFESK
ncbi:hypothetical protein TrRE_jg2692 [Triparma retinervis]|uniref:PNPLA domain-containing protein n=1 Tax=Triparma retinervis TaxID=2557542 RepID=A0A9W6Z4L9_9STRA|nr:hypothetical protein TrRE_jg2692 [Triparma retinervis]